MRLLRRIFLQNTMLKIGAVLIATALWVAYNSEPVAETSYSVPLLLVNVPPGLDVSGEVPSFVLLRLRGHLGRMRPLNPTEINVSADCTQAHAGTQLIRLTANLVNAPNNPEVVNIAPPQIEVSLVAASAPSRAHK